MTFKDTLILLPRVKAGCLGKADYVCKEDDEIFSFYYVRVTLSRWTIP